MLPSLRTILAAMCVTAILVTMVGTALTPIYPRVQRPLARYSRTESPMLQPAMHGYPRRVEEVEPSSESWGTSIHAKNLVTARVNSAENEAPGSASASAPEKPATNSTTQGADVPATASINPPSIATSESPSFAAAAKRMAERCVSCHRGFRPHGLRPRSGVRHRIRVTRDRFTTL
jgi:hypothetical protein